MSEEDAELVRRTMAGDRVAFDALCSTHLARARAVARSVLGDDPTVDDVLQEAFLRAYQRLGQLGEPATFPAWLCAIVRNESVSWIRRQARGRAVGLEQAGDAPQREADGENPRLAPLRSAFGKLSPSYREILAMKYDANLSYEQIAESLGTTVANVEKRLYRARQQLMEEMGKVKP
jgi:RNA polymerase sigma-70 factor (ECF subfamily)